MLTSGEKIGSKRYKSHGDKSLHATWSLKVVFGKLYVCTIKEKDPDAYTLLSSFVILIFEFILQIFLKIYPQI